MQHCAFLVLSVPSSVSDIHLQRTWRIVLRIPQPYPIKTEMSQITYRGSEKCKSWKGSISSNERCNPSFYSSILLSRLVFMTYQIDWEAELLQKTITYFMFWCKSLYMNRLYWKEDSITRNDFLMLEGKARIQLSYRRTLKWTPVFLNKVHSSVSSVTSASVVDLGYKPIIFILLKTLYC